MYGRAVPKILPVLAASFALLVVACTAATPAAPPPRNPPGRDPRSRASHATRSVACRVTEPASGHVNHSIPRRSPRCVTQPAPGPRVHSGGRDNH
jgi:hypothetical protein